MNASFSETNAGVLLYVRLTPNASSNRIEGIQEMGDGKHRLKVKVTVVPEKGKANKALLKLLSKILKLPLRDFKIVSGLTDRNKNVLIISEVGTMVRELKNKLTAIQ